MSSTSERTARPVGGGRLLPVVALLGLVALVVCWWLPPTSDDWRRIAFTDRSPGGFARQAIAVYQTHNGRIVGNTLSAVLIDPVWLRALVKAATVVALVLALLRVVGSRSQVLAVLAFAGVFLLPASVFRESFGWSAGFFNYVPPLVGVLVLVDVVGGELTSFGGAAGGAGRVRPARVLAHGVLAAVTCLFMEHVAVAVVGLALGAVAWLGVRSRRWSPLLGAWAVGSVVGTAVMLGSPGLRAVYAHEDAYFSYPSTLAGTVQRGLSNYATVTQTFVLSNLVLVVWLLAVAVGFAVRARRRGGRAGVDVAVAGAVAVVALYAAAVHGAAPERLSCPEGAPGRCRTGALLLDLVVLVVVLGLLVVLGLRQLSSSRDRVVWWSLLGGTLLMLGPLLVVSPIGPRNLFCPTVTVVGMLLLLTRDLLAPSPGGSRGGGRAVVGVVTVLAVAVLTARVVVIAHANGEVADERARLMAEAVEQRSRAVTLPAFPYPTWVHSPRDPKIGNRYYLEQPRDIAITWR